MRLLPDLHRADVAPEWEAIPAGEWNEHQRRAAETNGWDTPGNRITLTGVATTLAGLALINRDTPASTIAGTLLVGAGRVEDLRDGKVAAATGTKSPKGEAIDAGADTLLMLVAAMILKRREILSAPVADEMIANTGIKIASSLVGKLFGREMHTGRVAKYGTFARWGGVGTHLGGRIAKHLKQDVVSQRLGEAGSTIMDVGLKMDRHATGGFLKDALTPNSS